MDNVSKRLKCASCNIVICEVLAFIQNKLDVMDEQSLVQICESAFGTADIKSAKSLLFESLSRRATTRKRQGRTLRDLEDIICLLKETDPEEIPIFVARRLEKLPPVTFDHIDVTVLLKKIVLLEKNIQDFQHEYATKSELNDRINEYYKTSSFINQETNVNMMRGGGRFRMFGSGPMALPTLCGDESEVERNANYPSLSPVQQPPASSPATASEPQAGVTTGVTETDGCVLSTDKEEPSRTYCAPRTLSPTNKAANVCKQMDVTIEKRPSFSEVIQNDGEWKVLNKDEEWTMVQKRRHTNRFISQRGSAVVDFEEKSVQFVE